MESNNVLLHQRHLRLLMAEIYKSLSQVNFEFTSGRISLIKSFPLTQKGSFLNSEEFILCITVRTPFTVGKLIFSNKQQTNTAKQTNITILTVSRKAKVCT